MASMDHQLALITAMRKTVCIQNMPIKDLITGTRLISTLNKILSFTDQDEIYYLKLESLWIFNNLLYGEEELVDRVLISEPGEFDDVFYDMSQGFLDLVNKMMI